MQQTYPFQNRKFMILPFSPQSKLFNCNISSGVSWKSKIWNSELKKKCSCKWISGLPEFWVRITFLTRQAMYICHNMVVPYGNHCYSGKAVSVTYCECVCSLSYPASNAFAPYCHMWPAPLYNIFPHYLINDTIFEKKNKVLNTKCVFWFLCNVYPNISHSKKKWASYGQKYILVFM